MKKLLTITLCFLTFYSFADNPRTMGGTNYMYNNPTVNSRLYSGAIFTSQNQLTNGGS